MKAEVLEILSEKVHQVYCKQYEKDHNKPYWTNGDYSKLDEKTKEYDRAIVRFMEQYAAKESQEKEDEAFSKGHSIGYQKGKNEANIRNKRGY